MPPAEPPPLRYLTAAEVISAMPALDERLLLAEHTMTALAMGAELPSKIRKSTPGPKVRSRTRCRRTCEGATRTAPVISSA